MVFTYDQLTESYQRLLAQLRLASEEGAVYGPREGFGKPKRFIVMQGGTIEGKRPPEVPEERPSLPEK